MNSFTLAIFFVALASASASHLGLDFLGHGVHVAPVAHLNPAAHIPSGSVSVGHDGVVIAGPSGSVHTDNGLHGHGAGARLSGPAGEVGTHGGLARLAGPGVGHDLGHVVAPIAHVGHGAVLAGPVAHTAIVGPTAHATIVGPTAHAAVVAPAFAHVAAVPAVAGWGHHGVVTHGLVGYGHHGW